MALEDKIAEPVKWLSIGHYIKVDDEFYRIANVDALVYRYQAPTVTTELSIGNTNMEPVEGVMYAFVIGIQGRVAISINQPAATQKWGVDAQPRGWITYVESPYYNPSPLTFTVSLKARTFTLNIKNLDTDPQTPLIKYIGYKYELEPVSSALKAQLEKLYLAGRLPAVLTRGISKQGR